MNEADRLRVMGERLGAAMEVIDRYVEERRDLPAELIDAMMTVNAAAGHWRGVMRRKEWGEIGDVL